LTRGPPTSPSGRAADRQFLLSSTGRSNRRPSGEIAPSVSIVLFEVLEPSAAVEPTYSSSCGSASRPGVRSRSNHLLGFAIAVGCGPTAGVEGGPSSIRDAACRERLR
jgi:hypothetical protein